MSCLRSLQDLADFLPLKRHTSLFHGGGSFSYHSTMRANRLVLWALVVWLFSEATFAQHISFGVKGGAPFGDAFTKISSNTSPFCIDPEFCFNVGLTSKTRRYTVGPSIEISNLPFGFAVEIDALYKHLNYDTGNFQRSISSNFELFSVSGYSFHRWEFPILAKRQFNLRAFRGDPYVIGGFNINRVTLAKSHGVSGFRSALLGRPLPPFTISEFQPDSKSSGLDAQSRPGLAVGGGLDWRIPLVHILPELRYTRWFGGNFGDPCFARFSNVNQFEILLGVRF